MNANHIYILNKQYKLNSKIYTKMKLNIYHKINPPPLHFPITKTISLSLGKPITIYSSASTAFPSELAPSLQTYLHSLQSKNKKIFPRILKKKPPGVLKPLRPVKRKKKFSELYRP